MTETSALPKWIRPAIVAATAVVVLAAGSLVWMQSKPSAAESDLPTYGAMPEFKLVDQTGSPVTDKDLKGKILAVGFIYTSCTDICPMLTAQMGALQEEMQKAGLTDAELVSISVDPERDTPEVLTQYAAIHSANWRFLTGQVAMTRDVVVSGFLVGMEKTPASGHAGHGSHDAAESYEVSHSGRIVLVDKAGNLRAFYDGQTLDTSKVIADMQQLR
jgi:protein SCO1